MFYTFFTTIWPWPIDRRAGTRYLPSNPSPLCLSHKLSPIATRFSPLLSPIVQSGFPPRSLWLLPAPTFQPSTLNRPASMITLEDLSAYLLGLAPRTASHIRRALARAGQFTGFLWVRPMKTRKDVSALVTKSVRCVGRVGLAYDKREAVQEARASGELPAQNAGLPWGQWLLFPYLIQHKGKLYLRIYPVPNRRPRVIYRIDGRLASRAEVEPLCLSSEFSEVREDIGCMTLGVDNLRLVK